jgi:cyclopropane fatty-acyl-phospholipid synthase-like methyltransferase
MAIVNRFLNWYFPFRLKSKSYRQNIYRKALKRELRQGKLGRILLRNLGTAMAQDTSLHDEFAALIGGSNYQKCFWESDLGYWSYQDTLYSPVYNQYFEFALEEIKTNKLQSVLDVGCGWGRFCAEVIKLGVKHCKGIDISGEIISQAKKNFPDVAWAFEHRDVLEEAGDYDLVTSFSSPTYMSPQIYAKILEHAIIHANKEIIFVNSLRGIPFERALLIEEAVEVKRYDDGYLHPTNHLLKNLQKQYLFTYDLRKYGPDSILTRILKN